MRWSDLSFQLHRSRPRPSATAATRKSWLDFHRIWSTDWFMRREEEVERALRAFHNAVTASDQPKPSKGGNRLRVASEDRSFVRSSEPAGRTPPPRRDRGDL